MRKSRGDRSVRLDRRTISYSCITRGISFFKVFFFQINRPLSSDRKTYLKMRNFALLLQFINR